MDDEKVALAMVTLLVGGFLGYALRQAEFRRMRRLEVYSDYAAAFLHAVTAGAAQYAIHTHYGDPGPPGTDRTLYAKVQEEWRDAMTAMDRAWIQLRLVGSRRAKSKAESLSLFINDVVLSCPPFKKGQQKAEAQKGPRAIIEKGNQLATQFADSTSRDVVGLGTRARHKVKRTKSREP